MEIDQNLTLIKLSRLLFPSSFTSCQFRTLHDVVDSSITITPCSDAEGRKSPSVTPVICSNNHPGSLDQERRRNNENNYCKVKTKQVISSSCSSGELFGSISDDTDNLFSLSSNSGDSFRNKTSHRFNHEITKAVDGKEKNTAEPKKFQDKSLRARNDGDTNDASKTARICRRKTRNKNRTLLPGSGFTKGSCAVEKRSKDPRSDFRASMVEMILEKRISGARDLESLLLCFLSLNKVAYHEMIFEVFSEICETLLNN